MLFLSALCRASVGNFGDDRIGAQHRVGGQAKNIIDAIGFAKGHHLWPAIVPVATDGGPVAANMTEQPPNVPCLLDTRWRLAGPQQHRHRASRRRVVDMDREEAALPVVPIPEGQGRVNGTVKVPGSGKVKFLTLR